MMTKTPKAEGTAQAGDEVLAEMELSDEDILDAMRRIPGYLDISTEDFRAVYQLAHAHAIERSFRHVRAGTLMQTNVTPLSPDTRLDDAARQFVLQVRKSLPVVDERNNVVGVLAEADFLRRLRADSFLELLLRLVEDPGSFTHHCHETFVTEAMTTPAVTISEEAGAAAIINAFHEHEGRSMPVVDSRGRLRGLLLRKDFIEAFYRAGLS